MKTEQQQQPSSVSNFSSTSSITESSSSENELKLEKKTKSPDDEKTLTPDSSSPDSPQTSVGVQAWSVGDPRDKGQATSARTTTESAPSQAKMVRLIAES